MKPSKINSNVITIILFIIGIITTKGEDSATNGAVKGEVSLNETGAGIPPKAQFVTGMAEAADKFVYYIILREPQTGYTWWQEEFRPQKDDSFLSFASRSGHQDTTGFGKNIWVVPNVGIVWMSLPRLVLTDIKTPSIEDAQQQLIAGIKKGQPNGVWPLEQHQKEIRLPLLQSLGEDYFRIPGNAMLPPPPKVLALGFTDGTWSMKLESITAKTNRIAVVELDSNFKVLKAMRSN